MGTSPSAVASGDFNRDGRPDLATANPLSDDVSVVLGNGDGTFQSAKQFAAGVYPWAIVAGHFNADGILDLAITNNPVQSETGAKGVSVLFGNGDGTFQAPHLVSEIPAWSLAAADFNGDGRLDLATANSISDDVSVLLGNGDGILQSAERFAVGAYPWAISAGDLNGDGRLDLAIANGQAVSTLIGNGDGTFQAFQQQFALAGNASSLVAVDLNCDGRLDLAVALNVSLRSGSVVVLLGNGDGTFSMTERFAAGSQPQAIVAADFNADGRIDLATANWVDDVSLFLGNGDGTFEPETRFPGGGGQRSLIAADLNNDERPDLAITNEYSNHVSVLLGNGNGTFLITERFGAGAQPQAIVAADLNGDRRPDLATASSGSDISVLLGDGDGRFPAEERFATETTVGPVAIVAMDFNGDGRLDLATANSDSNDLSVLLGKGDGTYQPAERLATGLSPQSIVAANLNGDGRLDLATLNSNSNDVSVFLGNGDGTFQAQARFVTGDPLGLRPPWVPAPRGQIVAADINGDDRPDLATVNAASNDVSVLLGNGDGTFQAPQGFAAGGQPLSIAAADLNGDGWVDFAIGNSPGAVSVLLGNGDSTFQAPSQFAARPHPQAIVAADLNDDGRLDLATANTLCCPGAISVFIGNGDGAFQAEERFTTGGFPTSIIASDLNDDGRQDLAIAVVAGVARSVDSISGVVVLLNPSSDCNQNGILDRCDIEEGRVTDLNHDGIPDECEGIAFHRGDPNGDGESDISDGITILNFLFLGGRTPACKESADADNDGMINITDGISILNFLFLSGPPPAVPGPTTMPCGPDTDPLGSPRYLGCEAYDNC